MVLGHSAHIYLVMAILQLKNELIYSVTTNSELIMIRVDFIKKHDEKVRHIYDFLKHPINLTLTIKGTKQEGKKTALEDAIYLSNAHGQAIDYVNSSENSWIFLNTRVGLLKIVTIVYSWEDMPSDPSVQVIAFDRDPSYSSSSSSSSSDTS